MSQAPMAVYGQNIRFQSKLLGTDLQLQDVLWAALTDSHVKLPMAITAENLAVKYGISRADCDAYALRSQHAWGAAHKAGVFAAEIEPLEVSPRRVCVCIRACSVWTVCCARAAQVQEGCGTLHD
jgi:acetyl-CoA acyltransferase 2